ncbi:MAG: M48 family metallopeptidase [Sphingobium sp.]|nr:M48 family metallopeptidase [Sphingobium sp.]
MDSTGPDDAIWHYDGINAMKHHPTVEWDEHGVYLDWMTGHSGPHHWRLLEPMNAGTGKALFGLSGKPGWRLGFDRPLPSGFTIHLKAPSRYGGLIDRFGLWPSVGLFVCLAAAVIGLVVSAPAWIAPYVPRSWENAMGDAMVGDLGGRICETPASRAALDKLSRELAQGTELRQVAIVNVPVVNAITLPGGRILIFDKLIAQARSPDELAGVLGHEIGHVRHRDTMTALVRQLGLSVVLGGINGDVGNALNGVLAMSYSRDAERAADDFSIDAMRKADISPDATAKFFDGLSKSSGGEKVERSVGWMASHPVSADREAAFAKSAVKGHRYEAALDAAEWAALRNACRDDPNIRKDKDYRFRF